MKTSFALLSFFISSAAFSALPPAGTYNCVNASQGNRPWEIWVIESNGAYRSLMSSDLDDRDFDSYGTLTPNSSGFRQVVPDTIINQNWEILKQIDRGWLMTNGRFNVICLRDSNIKIPPGQRPKKDEPLQAARSSEKSYTSPETNQTYNYNVQQPKKVLPTEKREADAGGAASSNRLPTQKADPVIRNGHVKDEEKVSVKEMDRSEKNVHDLTKQMSGKWQGSYACGPFLGSATLKHSNPFTMPVQMEVVRGRATMVRQSLSSPVFIENFSSNVTPLRQLTFSGDTVARDNGSVRWTSFFEGRFSGPDARIFEAAGFQKNEFGEKTRECKISMSRQ